MAYIEIQNLFKRFKNTVAVNRIQLGVEKGEMLTLLGPSGCGKTTTLRCIAGLEKPEEGDIVIDGKPMLSEGFVQPSKRGIGMVFQNYAVWPHMKVFNNVAYGLKLQKKSKSEIREKTRDVLELVGLGGLEDRYPSQLSGGQQQRVALARALVRNPKVLLLDEPLSNLDAKLREELRFEIKSLVKRMGITSVYVTHDQAEAMVISDRIAVMDAGNVVQIGTARDIYQTPANKFVADFIGTMNFYVRRDCSDYFGTKTRPMFKRHSASVSGAPFPAPWRLYGEKRFMPPFVLKIQRYLQRPPRTRRTCSSVSLPIKPIWELSIFFRKRE